MNVAEASRWLEGKRGPARVHSVFSRSLNIGTEGTLLTLQNPGSPLVPMGARLERPCDFEGHGFRSGQPVRLEGERWVLGDVVFSFARSHAVDLTLRPFSGAADREKIDDAVDAILIFCLDRGRQAPSVSLLKTPLKAQGGGARSVAARSTPALLNPPTVSDPVDQRFLLSTAPGFRNATEVHLGEALDALRAWRENATLPAEFLERLIGAGPGLTPSGDDILVGILFALAWGANLPGVGRLLRATAETVRSFLRKTTDVAAAFLFHATEARFSQDFLALAEALENGRDPAPLLSPFADFGHTSGIDCLVGVAHGLKLLRDTILAIPAAMA